MYDRLLKDEHDEEAKQGLENISAEMTKSYSDIFLVPTPTPANRAEKDKADKDAREKADKEARQKAEREQADKDSR